MSAEPVLFARCPVHGLHGARDACYECGGPVEQVAFLPVDEADGWAEIAGLLALMRVSTVTFARGATGGYEAIITVHGRQCAGRAGDLPTALNEARKLLGPQPSIPSADDTPFTDKPRMQPIGKVEP